MIGRRVSHYLIEAELGSGSMGVVYRAEDMRHARAVALKLPHASLAPAEHERLRRDTVVGLEHPNIVTVYETGEADGTVFVAMQLVDGRTLRDTLRAPLPPARVIAIGRALAEALDHAHGRGIVHRDVKPENALVDDAGVVRLADFGSAHAPGAGVGAIVGTFPYVAPEVLQGAPPDPSTDLYALGVTLYELCVAAPPFDGTPAELIRRVAEPPPPLPVTVPSRLAELIERLLAIDPAARPASARETADALAALMPPPAPAGSPA